jgi:hypothetical protein
VLRELLHDRHRALVREFRRDLDDLAQRVHVEVRDRDEIPEHAQVLVLDAPVDEVAPRLDRLAPDALRALAHQTREDRLGAHELIALGVRRDEQVVQRVARLILGAAAKRRPALEDRVDGHRLDGHAEEALARRSDREIDARGRILHAGDVGDDHDFVRGVVRRRARARGDLEREREGLRRAGRDGQVRGDGAVHEDARVDVGHRRVRARLHRDVNEAHVHRRELERLLAALQRRAPRKQAALGHLRRVEIHEELRPTAEHRIE